MVHKGGGHQHPERICTKILHKMGLVSEYEEIDINRQLIVIIPMVSCTKVLLSESITISLQNIKNVLIGVPNKESGVDWCDVLFWLMLSKKGH